MFILLSTKSLSAYDMHVDLELAWKAKRQKKKLPSAAFYTDKTKPLSCSARRRRTSRETDEIRVQADLECKYNGKQRYI